MTDNKKIILDHTMKELEKMIESLKNGKIPTLPKTLKKLADIVDVADSKVKENKIKDEDLDSIFDKIAEDITKKK
jgi:hypothetical protein